MPLHDHSTPDEPSDPAAERHNARLGLILFAVYLAAYAAFVGITAFAPSVMDQAVGRLNVAVVYAVLCRTPAGVRK